MRRLLLLNALSSPRLTAELRARILFSLLANP